MPSGKVNREEEEEEKKVTSEVIDHCMSDTCHSCKRVTVGHPLWPPTIDTCHSCKGSQWGIQHDPLHEWHMDQSQWLSLHDRWTSDICHSSSRTVQALPALFVCCRIYFFYRWKTWHIIIGPGDFWITWHNMVDCRRITLSLSFCKNHEFTPRCWLFIRSGPGVLFTLCLLYFIR